ncbi:MAG: hypothetical protein ABEJ92_03385 [Halobacteriales archaeon]
MTQDGGCGPLYDLYAAARAGDMARVRAIWADLDLRVPADPSAADRLEAAVEAGDAAAVEAHAADLVFVDEDPTGLDGPAARLAGAVLFAFGYLAAVVLFVGAHSPESVVARLRWAYRAVGVDVRDTETVDGAERTVFRCPYRTIGADRYGERRVCHDVLDRVDDGYVAFLDRHRDLAYDRPRPCAGSACCYSAVARLE